MGCHPEAVGTHGDSFSSDGRVVRMHEKTLPRDPVESAAGNVHASPISKTSTPNSPGGSTRAVAFLDRVTRRALYSYGRVARSM